MTKNKEENMQKLPEKEFNVTMEAVCMLQN